MERPPVAPLDSLQALLNSVSAGELDCYSKTERRCRRRILRYSNAIQSVMAHRATRPRQGQAPTLPPPPPPLPPRVINPFNLDFLFEKRLQYSDVTAQGRIVIPKFVAELCFPALDEKEGMWMHVDDMDCGMLWTFRFRFWLNASSRMYLFDNTREFVLGKNLDWGDSVKWYKDRETGNYAISATKNDKTSRGKLGSDNNSNIIINAALLSPPPPPPPPLSLNTSQGTEDSAMEQLDKAGKVDEADETNPSKTTPSSSFIDTNPLKRKPSWSFIDLDDKATGLATTAYDELFADPAQGNSFWNFGADLNDAGMELSIMDSPEDCKKLEDVPKPGSEPINPFLMFK